MCTTHAFFMPNYSKTESAFMINGHHTYQDGISGMCAVFATSDQGKSGKYEYPFMKRKEMTYLQWTLAYLATPIAWYVVLKNYYKHKYDKNCIRKHPKYMTGKLKGAICKPISLRLAKLEAKKMDITFNDLILGMISKAMKQYFLAKGDKSTYITTSIPYSLASLPDRIEDYSASNNFASLIFYLDLEEDLKTAC